MSEHLQPTTTAPPVPIAKETDLVRRAKQFKDYAEAFQCHDESDYEMLGVMIERAAEGVKDALATFGEPKRLAHDTWKAIVAKEKAVVDPFTEGRLLLDRKGIAFKQEQARKAAEYQRMLDAATAETNRLAEEERQRKQAELEASSAAALREELGRALQQGATEAELAAIERHAPPVEVLPPVVMQPPVLVTAPATKGGPTIVENWQAQVTDEHALLNCAMPITKCEHCGKESGGGNGFARTVWMNPKVIETLNSVLTKFSKSMGLTLQLPGVRVWDAGSLRKGRGK